MFTGTAWFRVGRSDEPAVNSSNGTRRQTAVQSQIERDQRAVTGMQEASLAGVE